jgi:thioesterase domain-containing protein
LGDVPWEILGKVYDDAHAKYPLRPLDCRAVVFRSLDSSEAYLHAVDERMGWGGLFTGGVEVVDTPGDHFSLLKSPNILILAQKLNERVTRFQT